MVHREPHCPVLPFRDGRDRKENPCKVSKDQCVCQPCIQQQATVSETEMGWDPFRSAGLRGVHRPYPVLQDGCPPPPAGELCSLEEGNVPGSCKDEVNIKCYDFSRIKRIRAMGTD